MTDSAASKAVTVRRPSFTASGNCKVTKEEAGPGRKRTSDIVKQLSSLRTECSPPLSPHLPLLIPHIPNGSFINDLHTINWTDAASEHYTYFVVLYHSQLNDRQEGDTSNSLWETGYFRKVPFLNRDRVNFPLVKCRHQLFRLLESSYSSPLSFSAAVIGLLIPKTKKNSAKIGFAF